MSASYPEYKSPWSERCRINISSLRNNNVSVTNGLNQLRQVYINVTVIFQKTRMVHLNIDQNLHILKNSLDNDRPNSIAWYWSNRS